MTYRPGESGNLKGRPPKNRALADLLRRLLARKDDDGIAHREAILLQIIRLGRAGDLDAIKVIFERIDGKVTDTSEVTVDSHSEHGFDDGVLGAVLALYARGRGDGGGAP